MKRKNDSESKKASKKASDKRKKHILNTIQPAQSPDGENRRNWHNCDHMSGGGGN